MIFLLFFLKTRLCKNKPKTEKVKEFKILVFLVQSRLDDAMFQFSISLMTSKTINFVSLTEQNKLF